jgi:peptidoglycan/xylan/chitin deacetylase (PgdA/CDA1 family)
MPPLISSSNIFTIGTRTVSAPEHFRIRREPIAWPGEARVAVTWTVILELLTGPSVGKTRAYAATDAKYSLYGGRRGVWRILDHLDLHQAKASFLVSGFAAEKFPSAVEEIARRGHEIAGYGYATNRYLDELPPEKEREDILKTLDILAQLTGSRPTGWVSPDLRPGDRTLEILAEAGAVWNGDFPNDDLPYVVPVKNQPLVIIPYTKESDDLEIYQRNRQRPSVWTDCFIDSLDALYEEGETHPKMLNASLRAHLLGRSLGAKALDRAIRYAKTLPKVWFATRGEIARWWLERKYR